MKISNILSIGIINTIRMNIYYFGVWGVLRPRIIVSKNLKILKLGGTIKTADNSIGCIRIGFGYVGIVDKKYRRALWSNSGTIIFEGKAYFGVASRIVCDGELIFGDNCSISANSDIICENKITIGRECLFSWECLIMDTDFHGVYDLHTKKRLNGDKPIKIGEHVWVGCKSTILKGCDVPDNCVIAAGSVCTGIMSQQNAIYKDNSCIKANIYWDNH